MIIKEFVEKRCFTCELCAMIAAIPPQRCKGHGIVIYEHDFFWWGAVFRRWSLSLVSKASLCVISILSTVS